MKYYNLVIILLIDPFYSYSMSSQMQFQTASPPDPPTNLTVCSTTCHAIKICWDPPIPHGSELVAVRVDCHQLNVEKPVHIFKELTADIKSCIIDNLSEKTNYRISVTAITEEYFINHKIKELKQLPRLILDNAPWLPSASVEAMTSGTDPATNLEWKPKPDKSINIHWRSAKVYGTNRMINQVLCHQELDPNNITWPAVRVPLPVNVKSHKLLNLRVGSKYKIWVETVVQIKVNIDSDTMCMVQFDLENEHADAEFKIDHFKELKDSRCTNVVSESLFLRVPAPCEPVTVHLSGYTSETIDIYWAKPNLHSQHRDPENGDQKLNLYRHLIGYRLEVNGIRQRSIAPNETICTLTKCRPQNTYNIVIVALTCLSTAMQSRDPRVENEVDINEIDESYSAPIQVKLFGNDRENQVTFLAARHEYVNDGELNDENQNGRIVVEWSSKSTKGITGYTLNWFCVQEAKSQSQSCDAKAGKAFITVLKQK
jgi:hypothetical protein